MKKIFRNPNYGMIISLMTIITTLLILFNIISILEKSVSKTEPLSPEIQPRITGKAIQTQESSSGIKTFYIFTGILISFITIISIKLYSTIKNEK